MKTPSANDGDLRALINRVKQRYTSELFHLADASRFTILSFRLPRLLWLNLRWVHAIVHTAIRPTIAKNSFLGLYETRNQHKALQQLADAKQPDLILLTTFKLDFWLSVQMTFYTAITICLYVVKIWWVREYAALHDVIMIKQRAQALLKAIGRIEPDRLVVSNDHQGQIFWIGFLLSKQGLPVEYVQHGKVKETFPTNYFSHCYVRDDAAKDIYQNQLCLNRNVAFTLLPEQGNSLDAGLPVDLHILIALSHQFNLLETRRTIRASKKIYGLGMPVSLRFHPSDRLARAKSLACAIGFKCVSMDSSTSPFLEAFKRCEVALCASSSILAEAAELDPHRVIWIKSLGLEWDYYDLSETISIYDTADAFLASHTKAPQH